MEEGELEKVMVEFFHHEIDMLLCTTIVESGMDISKANTMFIDNSQQLGLSQLYQLRGRVGRSKERAYCYLLVPNHQKLDKDAQERLRILQENSSLGSGIRIAQYDLGAARRMAIFWAKSKRVISTLLVTNFISNFSKRRSISRKARRSPN